MSLIDPYFPTYTTDRQQKRGEVNIATSRIRGLTPTTIEIDGSKHIDKILDSLYGDHIAVDEQTVLRKYGVDCDTSAELIELQHIEHAFENDEQTIVTDEDRKHFNIPCGANKPKGRSNDQVIADINASALDRLYVMKLEQRFKKYAKFLKLHFEYHSETRTFYSTLIPLMETVLNDVDGHKHRLGVDIHINKLLELYPYVRNVIFFQNMEQLMDLYGTSIKPKTEVHEPLNILTGIKLYKQGLENAERISQYSIPKYKTINDVERETNAKTPCCKWDCQPVRDPHAPWICDEHCEQERLEKFYNDYSASVQNLTDTPEYQQRLYDIMNPKSVYEEICTDCKTCKKQPSPCQDGYIKEQC